MIQYPTLRRDLQHTLDSIRVGEAFADTDVVLTGCAGFLGFYFMHFFAEFGPRLGVRRVLGLDNFKLGRPAWLDELIAQADGRVDVRPFDVVTGDLAAAMEGVDDPYILHMASIASPMFYRQYPLETIDANIGGLRKVLDYARSAGSKGVLFFSSSEIYGDPSDDCIPTDEEYRGLVSPVGPRACYDEAKRFGETLCYTFAQQFGAPVTVVRPFNNFGPGMRLDDRRAPADFAKAVLENRDIVMYSDGAPTRTFCYIADSVAGYLQALTYGKFDYFNIGMAAPEISIRRFAELFIEAGADLCGYTGQLRLEVSPDADYLTHNPSRRRPKTDKAEAMLGYKAKIVVDEGVRRFLAFHLDMEGRL